MSVQNTGPSPFVGMNVPSPGEFRSAAASHAAVQLALHGEEWDVKGVGSMPGSGRQVQWVEAGAEAVDTTSVFVQSLSKGFSEGVGKAIARELDLQPAPGRPLSSRSVQDALQMAEASVPPLEGVNFMTRLDLSAASNGGGFRQVAQEAGIDPAGLSAVQKQDLDARMARRFEAAAGHGAVPPQVAAQWLREELKP